MKRSVLPVLAALLAACSSSAPPETITLHEPTAAAAFLGWTPQHPRQAYPLPQPYLAVANGRSDDLRLVDLATKKALMSPGFAFPLSVPTLARPTYLAATSLRDGGADLLAVASSTPVALSSGAAPVIDVVGTWDDRGTKVAAQYDLSGLAGPGAQVLCMVATAVPGQPAGTPPAAPAQPGRAWLVVGFSGSSDGRGGKLVVLEFARAADGSVVVGAPVQVKPLGFDPVSLAVAPDLFHLYVATPDVITDFTTFPPAPTARQVLGVAEVDMRAGAAGPWPVRGLAAVAGTTLVAAAVLGERVPTDTRDPNVYGPPALRVYAALDASGCGGDALHRKPIECGIAVIDPALGGLAADLASAGPLVPAQAYRTPIMVPAFPLTLSVAMPAGSGPLQCISDTDPCGTLPGPNRQPLMLLAANGARWTTAVAAVGAGDGLTYLLDLGKSGPAADLTEINADGSRTMVTSAESLTPLQADGSQAKAGLGLYVQYPLGTGATQGLTSDSAKLPQGVVVTPGFTRGETWTLVWQGYLPGLHGADFVLGVENGNLYLAFQSGMGGQWAVGAQVADPALGIHAADAGYDGDLAQFTLPDAQFGSAGNPCPLASGTSYETIVASIVPATAPPSTIHPGGALSLAVPAVSVPDPFRIRCLRDWLAGAGTTVAGIDGNVRASGLVLTGSASGYAGRPLLLSKADLDSGLAATKRFNLAWQDESSVAGETLALARKARRLFYPNDAFNPPTNADNYPESRGNPLTPGVALGLIAGPLCADQPAGSGVASVCPPERMGDLLRDSALIFTTRSGLSPTTRWPSPSSLPSSTIAFDRSYFPDGGNDGPVFYVTYREDALLEAIPGQPYNVSPTLR